MRARRSGRTVGGMPTTAPPQAEIERFGRDLGQGLARAPRGLKQRADELFMARVSRDPEVKAALFRLVDVRPACADAQDVGRHLAGLLAEVGHPDRAVGLARRAASGRVSSRLTGRAVGTGVGVMAGRFIAGADAADALPAFRRMWEDGVGTTVDLLGEATVTAEEADEYAARCAETLITLTDASAAWPARPTLEQDAIGPLPRANLSVKMSALTPHLRPDAPERGIADATPRLRALLRLARDRGAHLHVDMESLDSREAVLEAVLALLAEDEFRLGPSAGVVLQAYLREAPDHLEELIERAAALGHSTPLTIRLVKGAYWDHELVHAKQVGWPVPVWEDRASCDRCFEQLTRRALAAFPTIRLAVASHNVRSVAHARAAAASLGLAPTDVEYQVLRGLGDDLQAALAGEGLRVRTYAPVGDLVAGMAYLVRRLLENTANDSFLQQRTSTDLHELLVAP